jgi:hypothetical protein
MEKTNSFQAGSEMPTSARPTDEQLAAIKPWVYRAFAAMLVGLLSYVALVAYWMRSNDPDHRVAVAWFLGTWLMVRLIETICLRRMNRIAPQAMAVRWRRHWFLLASTIVIIVLMTIVFLKV